MLEKGKNNDLASIKINSQSCFSKSTMEKSNKKKIPEAIEGNM